MNCTNQDMRTELVQIVKEELVIPYGKLYCYPDISDKAKATVTKFFDATVNTNSIVAVCDTTLMGSGTNGLVFMRAGVYYRGFLEKTFYFNYADVARMETIADKKGRTNSTDASLHLSFSNGSELTIGYGDFQKDNLKEVLVALQCQLRNDDVVLMKPSGIVGEVHLTEGQEIKCHAIIHTAATAAGGVGTGLAQIPLSDNLVITPIQITMITSIGAVFEIRITEGAATGILAGAAAAFVGRGAVQLILGWIPGIGNAINTATAFGLTEAIGWLAVAHFFDLQQQDRAKYKVDGMKDGYVAAAEEYEVKLRKQATEFIKQKKVYREEREQYEQLLNEYEKYIHDLEREQVATGVAHSSLLAIKSEYSKLYAMNVG